MQIFIILNLVKLVIAISVIYIARRFTNLEMDFIFSVSIMGIGIFLLLRSLSFFILLGILTLIDKKPNTAFTAYKYTGLFAFYFFVNFILISFHFWNKRIGFAFLIMFLILGIIL